MADRAEIKVTLDAKQAKGEARRARQKLVKDEERVQKGIAKKFRERRKAEDSQMRSVLGGSVIGRAAAERLGGTAAGSAMAKGGALRTATGAALGTAAGVAAVAETVLTGADVLSEALVRPIVESVVKKVVPQLFPHLNEDELAEKIEGQVKGMVRDFTNIARDQLRNEFLVKQISRLQTIETAAAFGVAGEGFTLKEALGLSSYAVRENERKHFLKQQESQRTVRGVTKTIIEGIAKGLGE